MARKKAATKTAQVQTEHALKVRSDKPKAKDKQQRNLTKIRSLESECAQAKVMETTYLDQIRSLKEECAISHDSYWQTHLNGDRLRRGKARLEGRLAMALAQLRAPDAHVR